MDTLRVDLKLAARMLRRNPTFALIAVTTLALGIGANTAIFAVVDKALLNPLPYPQAARIVALQPVYRNGQEGLTASVPDYDFWRANTSDILQNVSAYNFSAIDLSLTGGARPEQVRAVKVSKNYFRLFGAMPTLGRSFSAQEDSPGGARVAVISHELWRQRFGARPSIIGETLVLNNEPYTIIGVLPSRFQPQISGTDVWLPLQADPNSSSRATFLRVAARLLPGVSLAEANARMKLVAAAFRAARGPRYIGKGESAAVRPLAEVTNRNARPLLLALMAAVVLVLLITCANVANLSLARASGRRRELAIRSAIGAGRGRIVRQLLTESILLTAVAAVLGLLFGIWGAHGLLLVAPLELARTTLAEGIPLNGTVLLFTLGTALLTSVLFGLLPAWYASKPDLSARLQESGGLAPLGSRRSKGQALLVITETALTVALLVGAVLMIRTFAALERVAPGFDPHGVVTISTSLVGKQWGTTAAVRRYEHDVVQRLDSTPGVTAAASTMELPATGENLALPFEIEGRPVPPGRRFFASALYRPVSPDYFHVFRIPLRFGRLFDQHDTGTSAPVALINETMVKRFWRNQNPIGRRLTIGRGMGPQFADVPRIIVGVVANVREGGLRRAPPPVIYIPSAQVPNGITRMTNALSRRWWVIRTRADPLSMISRIDAQFTAVNDQVGVANASTMDQILAQTTAQQTFSMQLMSAFAAAALLLTAIGIFGVVAYIVEQRTGEIGVRMAVGATATQVKRLVAGHVLVLAAAGVTLGLGGAFALARLLRGMLYGVGPADPLTYAAAAVALSLVAVAASWVPARRATQVDPATTLRQ